MTTLARLTGAAIATLWLSSSALGQDLNVADPRGAGFSAERLARLTPWYRSQVDAGRLSGAVVAIARDGKLATLQAIGTYDRAGKVPLKPDAIFWIASMTKPVTSVAAMMLVEEGKLELEAPVAKYLPELDGMKVGLNRASPKRPMQVIDLLRHTAGLTYPEEGDDELHRAYGRVTTFRRDRTLADFVIALAAMPLLHQPGEVWEYSWGVDVLARVIEVVSGQTFDQFLESRIFKPLRMVDTGFSVPEAKLDRLVDPIPGGRPSLWDVTRPTKLFSGGGGLVSTAPDYLRFCQMLLNGGELDGARILAADTVRRMTTNALPADVRFAGVLGQYVGPRVGTGWGLGFAIRTNPEFSLLPGAVGSFNWSGVWGTYFWIDPTEKLIAVQMIQVPPDAGVAYRDALRHLTYAALSVPQPAVSPPLMAAVSADVLKRYAGTYDFGRSLSSHDRQAPSRPSPSAVSASRFRSPMGRPSSAIPSMVRLPPRPACDSAISSPRSTTCRSRAWASTRCSPGFAVRRARPFGSRSCARARPPPSMLRLSARSFASLAPPPGSRCGWSTGASPSRRLVHGRFSTSRRAS